MTHHILYIPGLGDGYDAFREAALRFWPIYAVKAQLIPMQWYGNETYDDKFQRASDVIRSLIKKGARITLVGESAGGSMAINLFAAHPEVAKLITVAGVNQVTTPVAQRTLRKGPAFAVSRLQVANSLSQLSNVRRRNIHTVSALFDAVVSARYSQIAGAQNHQIPTGGHFITITVCLTILSGYVVYLAKK